MPVPTEEAGDPTVTAGQTSTAESHCNTGLNNTANCFIESTRGMLEVYYVHVNTGDTFTIPNVMDGSMQNITGPVVAPMYVPSGVSPTITAPPGYIPQFREDNQGVKHVFFVPGGPHPMMDAAPHQHPPMPMHGLHQPHVHHGFFPPSMVTNLRPEAGPYYHPSLVVYPEEARMTGDICLPSSYAVVAGDVICDSGGCAVARPVISRQIVTKSKLKDSFMKPVKVIPKFSALSQAFTSALKSIRNLNQWHPLQENNEHQFKNLYEKKLENVSLTMSTVCQSRCRESVYPVNSLIEMSESYNSMHHNAHSNPPSSDPDSSVPPHDWHRSNHLHPDQTTYNDSPPRASSSMTSSSTSTSSMTSSPRHSPTAFRNSFHANGHRSSRSPLRQSAGIRQYRPTPGHYHHTNQADVDLAAGAASSSGDKALSNEEHGRDRSIPDRPFSSVAEFLKSVTTTPKVKDIEARSAVVTWEPLSVESVTSDLKLVIEENPFVYDLYLFETKKSGKKIDPITCGSELERTVEKLMPGVEYSVRICAKCDKETGLSSEATTFKTLSTVPDAPGVPRLMKRTKDSLQLKWISPCDNGEKIFKYYLELDDNENPSTFRSVYIGSSKQTFVKRLKTQHSYNLRLAAENKLGKSEWSPVCTYETLGVCPSIPDPPQLASSSMQSLTLNWQKQPEASGYVLQMDDTTSGYGFIPVYNGPDLSHTKKDLKRVTKYKFRLKAVNNYGESQFSKMAEYSTSPDKPHQPVKLRVKGKLHAKHIALCWDPPKDTGGTEVISYCVEWKTNQDEMETIYEGAEREYTVTDLEPGNTYYFQVRCMTKDDTSAPSDVLAVTTLPVLPGRCEPPMLAMRPKPTFLTIKWESPSYDGGAPVHSYEVDYVAAADLAELKPVVGYEGAKLECTINKLLPGTKYSFAVRAHNKAGFGSWSDRLEVKTSAGAPEQPEMPQVSHEGATTVHLEWKAPHDNGADISSYIIHYGAVEAALANTVNVGPELSCEISNLSPNTTYFYSLQAINSAGTSAKSDIGTVVTLPSCPDRVSNLRFNSDTVTSTSFFLSWEEPSNNGAEIAGYEIRVSVDTSGFRDHALAPSNELFDIEENTTLLEVENRIPDTFYTVQVRAKNEHGYGPLSAPLKVMTKPTKPDTPELECVERSYNSLKLAWKDRSARTSTSTRYLLQRNLKSGKTSGKSKFSEAYRGDKTSFVVANLNELTVYGFRIYAINSEGSSPMPKEQFFKTGVQAPAAMKAPTVREVKATQCHVSWPKSNRIKDDVISYEVTLTSQGDDNVEKKLICEGTKHILSGLTPCTEYRVTVTAMRRLHSRNSSPSNKDLDRFEEVGNDVRGPSCPPVPFRTLEGCIEDDSEITLIPLLTEPQREKDANFHHVEEKVVDYGSASTSLESGPGTFTPLLDRFAPYKEQTSLLFFFFLSSVLCAYAMKVFCIP